MGLSYVYEAVANFIFLKNWKFYLFRNSAVLVCDDKSPHTSKNNF